MTRSLHAVLHGELAASFRYHLLGPAVFLGIFLFQLVFAAEAISGKKYSICPIGKIRRLVIGMFAIVWLVYWGIRLAAEFVS
jgi:undecaprenyl pyrophosphate phosphatase UppP